MTIDDEVDSLLASVVVTDALDSLSAQHRQVIGEVYSRGSSSTQASIALGIPPGTVKSRSYYALRALRAALEERGVTGSPVASRRWSPCWRWPAAVRRPRSRRRASRLPGDSIVQGITGLTGLTGQAR